MYISRYNEKSIEKASKTFPILYLGGPRQVGKTTLLLHLSKKFKMNYVTMDDLSIRDLAKRDPELFLEQYPGPLLIDEVQYVPELFPYLKIHVDKSKRKGQFWLTGSQHFDAIKYIQESLTGRVGILYLLGLSWAEVRRIKALKQSFSTGNSRIKAKKINQTNIRNIFKYILTGSFPALHAKQAPERELFYRSYVETYINRDLRELFGITKTSQFHTFLQLCAARTGQLLNYSELARDADISHQTARDWIGMLESTMQIYLLKPHYANISLRMIKSSKLYFLDTGLAAYLTKWKTIETLQNGAMAGAFFETFVIGEVVKSYLFRGLEPPIYYYRDKEGHEVDLILEKDQVLHPIEIKLASLIKDRDVHNLTYFYKKNKNVGKGAVVCLSSNHFLKDRFTEIVPVDTLN